MILDVYDLGVLDRANRAAAEIRTYLADLAKERRRHPQDDLISSMVTMTGDDGAVHDEDEVVTMAALLFSAGFETTTHLLGNGLVALLDNPEQAETLRTSPDLAATAIGELIRFDTSVQISSRVALANTTWLGSPSPRELPSHPLPRGGEPRSSEVHRS